MIDEKLAIWALAGIEGIGRARVKALVDRFGTASAVFEQSVEALTEVNSFNKKAADIILKKKNWDLIEKKFYNSLPENSQFITMTDEAYPEKLRNIPDPPPYFYYSGHPGILSGPCLGVVGTRKPSDYGERVTRNIVNVLAAAGIVIVSGLAYGIDSVAHKTALKSGGRTVAVFGNGLDIIYPPGNRNLAEEIRENGCLISEFPKGTKPERYNFPVRNRIIAGLCDGVLVVEAQERSGALITANHALDQGRDVLAVPGNIDNRLSNGPNILLKQGAIPVSSAADIFDNFRWHEPGDYKKPSRRTNDLSKDEKIVFELLSAKPVHLDELTRKAGLGTGKTAEVLLNLELKGFILRKPGNYLVLT
jgi:DNA processing protein